MYCNKCGQPLPEESAFCNKCGNDLRGLFEGNYKKPETNSVNSKVSGIGWFKKLLTKLSENIVANVLICTGSVIALLTCINNIRDVYNNIIFKLNIIDLQRQLVDLSYRIDGSARSDEAKLRQLNLDLYLGIGKVVLFGVVIIISLLLIIYFSKKLIPLIKIKMRSEKNGG